MSAIVGTDVGGTFTDLYYSQSDKPDFNLSANDARWV